MVATRSSISIGWSVSLRGIGGTLRSSSSYSIISRSACRRETKPYALFNLLELFSSSILCLGPLSLNCCSPSCLCRAIRRCSSVLGFFFGGFAGMGADFGKLGFGLLVS